MAPLPMRSPTRFFSRSRSPGSGRCACASSVFSIRPLARASEYRGIGSPAVMPSIRAIAKPEGSRPTFLQLREIARIARGCLYKSREQLAQFCELFIGAAGRVGAVLAYDQGVVILHRTTLVLLLGACSRPLRSPPQVETVAPKAVSVAPLDAGAPRLRHVR